MGNYQFEIIEVEDKTVVFLFIQKCSVVSFMYVSLTQTLEHDIIFFHA